MDFGEDLISRTITYLLIFPTTFFFSGVYSESLFLALTAAAFYYARTNRWLLSCILVALATVTRSQGMIIALPLLIEYLHERNFRLQKIGWNITAFALVPTALLAFALFLKLKFGSWTVMFDVQGVWARTDVRLVLSLWNAEGRLAWRDERALAGDRPEQLSRSWPGGVGACRLSVGFDAQGESPTRVTMRSVGAMGLAACVNEPVLVPFVRSP